MTKLRGSLLFLLSLALLCGLHPSPAHADPRFPMSLYDPVFANVTYSDTLLGLYSSEIVNDKSIATGDPSVMGTAFTLNRVRIRSRECVRAGGSGAITLNWVFAEAVGATGDHADAVQCYQPGSVGVMTINNSTLRAHTANATAGYFASDDWRGDHVFNHVLFWGGPIGLRITCDGGRNVSLNDVYFVSEGGGYPYLLNDGNCYGPGIKITQWTDVFEATIVNGQLVVGDPLPPPCSPVPCYPPLIPMSSEVPVMSRWALAILAFAILAAEAVGIHRLLPRAPRRRPGA